MRLCLQREQKIDRDENRGEEEEDKGRERER